MKATFINTFFILFMFQAGIAQNIKGKIIDSKTGESIPYANIKVNESENLVSNAEGFFTLSESNSREETELTVSYLGFVNQQLTVADLIKGKYIIGLVPGVFQLDDVMVSNEKRDPYKIMANVKANLERNYKNDGKALKEMLFLRKSNYFKPITLEVEIDKSTGFSKQSLNKINADIKSFSSKLISRPPQEFTDILCNFYSAKTKKNDKQKPLSKLDVLKATKLKNEGSTTSLDELQEMTMNTMLQHLDSTKYYRAKSGLFGSRDTISLRKDFHRNKKATNQLLATKSSLISFLKENNFLNSSNFDFINRPELYEYKYEGATYTNYNEFAYVLSFKPRRSKAKYVGKLYVSETDYAVLRSDFTLEEGKKAGGFNMKFLLGVKASENISKGTITYKKKVGSDGYYMQYAAVEKGHYFYLNRPLKFIELTKSEKDILSLDLKIEGNTRSKTEFLNISQSEISEAAVDKIKEKDFKYINIKSYDPKIWKDYNAIEPAEEMKRFKGIN